MNYINYLKSVFGLQGKKVEWGIIEETTHPVKEVLPGFFSASDESNVNYKPGLYIHNSRVYVDLLARRLFSTVELSEISRKIHRARWKAVRGGYVVIEAREDSDMHIVLGRHFIEDIYNIAIYGAWMEERLLL